MAALAIAWLVLSVGAHWYAAGSGKPIKPTVGGATIETIVALFLAYLILRR